MPVSHWADKPPLVLTRPAAQQAAWQEALTALGVTVVGWPMIDIAPAHDPKSLTRAWHRLPDVDLVFFASPNAVAAVMAACPPGKVWPDRAWAACVGPGSAEALRAAGVPSHKVLSPPSNGAQFDSEALWPILQRLAPWAGKAVLLLRGQGGREWLADRLRADGAFVEAEAVYQRQCPRPNAEQAAILQTLMAAQPEPLWLLSSSEAVSHWQTLAGPLPPLPVLATHPRIAAAARAAGLRVTEVLPTVQAVADAWHLHVAGPLQGGPAAP